MMTYVTHPLVAGTYTTRGARLANVIFCAVLRAVSLGSRNCGRWACNVASEEITDFIVRYSRVSRRGTR